MSPDLLTRLDEVDEHVQTMTAEALMLRHEVAVQKRLGTLLSIAVGVIGLVGVTLVGLALLNRDTLVRVSYTQDYLIECTTPGPTVPTPEDPRTGHPCFDAAQARTGAAVQAIIDALRP